MSRRRDRAVLSAAKDSVPVPLSAILAAASPIPQNVHLLDRANTFDHVVAILEDPRVELVVGLVAGGCAVFELAQDFSKVGSHHAVVLVTLIHALKAVSSIIKESKNVAKGISKSYHNRFHN